MLHTLPRLTITALILSAGAAAFILAGSLGLALARRLQTASAVKSGTRIGLRHTRMGTLLVNRHGFTLYVFSRDRPRSDRCVGLSGCSSVWGPVTSKGRPLAETGVKSSRLGTIRLPGGRRQVTYFGHPLYTYSFDSGPGRTNYIGVRQFRGVWRAITATGKTIS
jgi:predicted lipoprotein with Yx(FWY)xxD motif